MDQKIPRSLFSFSKADTSKLQRDAVMMQRGAAAGILPPNPGKTADSHVNAPLWFYCLLRSFFLQSGIRDSPFMHKHSEAASECPCLLQEPVGRASTLAWRPKLQLRPGPQAALLCLQLQSKVAVHGVL